MEIQPCFSRLWYSANGKPSVDHCKYVIKMAVDQTIIQHERGHLQTLWSSTAWGFDLQIWLWLMGQGQVNIAKQVIQRGISLTFQIAGLQTNDKHQTHELLFEIRLRWWICLAPCEFFLPTHPRWGTALLSLSTANCAPKFFHLNWMDWRSDSNASRILWRFQVFDQNQGSCVMRLSKLGYLESLQRLCKESWTRRSPPQVAEERGLPNQGNHNEP